MFAEIFAEAEIGDATRVAGAQQSFKSDLVAARETAGHVVYLVFLWNALSTKPSSIPYHKYGGWSQKALLLLPLLPFSLSGLRALRSESKSCVMHMAEIRKEYSGMACFLKHGALSLVVSDHTFGAVDWERAFASQVMRLVCASSRPITPAQAAQERPVPPLCPRALSSQRKVWLHHGSGS
jgi:hypothetical protein